MHLYYNILTIYFLNIVLHIHFILNILSTDILLQIENSDG